MSVNTSVNNDKISVIRGSKLHKVNKAEIEKTQTLTFTKWANNILKPKKIIIRNIVNDLKNGETLIILVSQLLSLKPPKYVKNTKKPILMASNISLALSMLNDNGISTGAIQPMEIIEGNITSILGLMWITISQCDILKLNTKSIRSSKKHKKKPKTTKEIENDDNNVNKESEEKLNFSEKEGENEVVQFVENVIVEEAVDPKKVLLSWVNKFTCKDAESKIKNFQEDWADGSLLCSIVDNFNLDAALINHTIKDPKLKNKHALEVAFKHYGIVKLITPEAITEGHDDQSLMTYISLLKKEYETDFETFEALKMERVEIANKEQKSLKQLIRKLLQNNGITKKEGEEITYFKLGKLLEKLININLNLDEKDDTRNRDIIIKLLNDLGFNIKQPSHDEKDKMNAKETESLENEIFKAILMTNSKKSENLLNWVNSLLDYDIPIDELVEVIRSGEVLGDLINRIYNKYNDKEEFYLLKESEFESNNEELIQKCFDKIKEQYKIDSIVTAKDFLKTQSSLIANFIINELYKETEAKEVLKNFEDFFKWIENTIHESGYNVREYDDKWKSAEVLVKLLKALDSELDYSVIEQEKNDKKRWDVLKEVLISRFGIHEAIKLNTESLSNPSKSTFDDELLNVISLLKTEEDHGMPSLVDYNEDINSKKNLEALKSEAETMFGVSLESVDDIKSSKFLKAYLDYIGLNYDENGISDLTADKDRAQNFIKIVKENSEGGDYEELDSLKRSLTKSPGEALHHMVKSAKLHKLNLLNKIQNKSNNNTNKNGDDDNSKEDVMEIKFEIKHEHMNEHLLTIIEENIGEKPLNFDTSWMTGDYLISIIKQNFKDFIPPYSSTYAKSNKNSINNENTENLVLESIDDKLQFVEAFALQHNLTPLTKKDLFSGTDSENVTSFIVDVLTLANKNKVGKEVLEWIEKKCKSADIEKYNDLFIDKQIDTFDKLTEEIIRNDNYKIIYDLLNEIDPIVLSDSDNSLVFIDSSLEKDEKFEKIVKIITSNFNIPPPSLSTTVKDSKDSDNNDEYDSYYKKKKALQDLLTTLYLRSLSSFPIRKRINAQIKKEQEELEHTTSQLDLLASLAESGFEPELNKAGYNVQFTISASSKKDKDKETGSHIKAQVKGPFPINLSKRYKKTKLETVMIETITRVGEKEYRCNYIPKHQGIYQIRIYIYKKETNVSPIYFAITSKGGFWLKITPEGKIVTTDHDVLKQSDYANQKKADITTLKNWRKSQAKKEMDYKKEKTDELVEKELEKFKAFDNIEQEVGTMSKKQTEEKEEHVKQLNKNAISALETIMSYGVLINVLKRGWLSSSVKETYLGLKYDNDKDAWKLFEFDKNFEERAKFLEIVPFKTKFDVFFDKAWIKKFKDVNFNNVVKATNGKKEIVFEMENERYCEYFLKAYKLLVEITETGKRYEK